VNPDLNVQDAYIDEMLCSNPLMYNFCVFMYQLNEFNLKKKAKNICKSSSDYSRVPAQGGIQETEGRYS
jgi:hypothetical protein